MKTLFWQWCCVPKIKRSTLAVLPRWNPEPHSDASRKTGLAQSIYLKANKNSLKTLTATSRYISRYAN